MELVMGRLPEKSSLPLEVRVLAETRRGIHALIVFLL